MKDDLNSQTEREEMLSELESHLNSNFDVNSIASSSRSQNKETVNPESGNDYHSEEYSAPEFAQTNVTSRIRYFEEHPERFVIFEYKSGAQVHGRMTSTVNNSLQFRLI